METKVIYIIFIIFIHLNQVFCNWPQKGITFTNGKYCPEVKYGSQESFYSLEQLQSTGANYVAIIVTEYQKTQNSTEIFPIYNPIQSSYYTYITETQDQLISIIEKAHQMQLQVMLKLQIDLIEDDEHWRGDIGEYFNQKQWNDWFNSYENALQKYARLAQRLEVEQFSVGCELIATNDQEANWRKLIKNIRKIFTGIIIDSANWGFLDERGGEETHKKWWDAVDIMGIDAYYPIGNNITDPTIDQLIEQWQPVIERYRNLTQTFNKPIIMAEIGYCSSSDCQRGQKVEIIDYKQQALHYEAAFKAFENVDFPFYGFFWWTWNSDPGSGGMQDECITPQGKPAELVLRQFYRGTKILPKWPEPAQCQCTV